MIDHQAFDELAKRLAECLPASVRDMQHDLEKNFRSVLQAFFAKLDLVTREEFDAQVALLHATRAKLDALEAQLSAQQQSNPSQQEPSEDS